MNLELLEFRYGAVLYLKRKKGKPRPPQRSDELLADTIPY